MSQSTQLVVIGAGPGGYAAAFYAADLGMDVTLVDPSVNPGGVCLYRGCIPSKALLHVADVLNEARHAAAWGVTFGEPKIDVRYYTRVPWITDMDYEHPDVLDRFAIALRQLSLHIDLPYGKSYKHKFLLLTARPAVSKASGLALEGQSEAVATVQGRVSVLAHEFGHTLGATHESAASGRFRTGPWSLMNWYRCDSNMHPLAPSTFSCLRYTPDNERAIRSYMRHGPVAERTDLWLERR
jgi:hypothetical protein